jgi:hypothetical protein
MPCLALLLTTPPDLPAEATVLHWELDGTLESAVGAAPLKVEPGASFELAPMPGASEPVKVLRLAPKAVLRAPVPFSMGTPGYQARWMVVMDVQVTPPGFSDDVEVTKKKKGPGWTLLPLLQTDPWNDDDAEMMLDAKRGLEVGGERGGSVDPRGWHRLAMVVDEQAGTVTGFIDGVMTRRVKTTIADSRWTLEPELVLFGAKKESHPGLRLAALQVRTGPIEAGHVELLGKVVPEGLPKPGVPVIAWRQNPPATLSVGERFSAAFRVSPPSGEVALWLVREGAGVELGRVASDGAVLQGAIPPDVTPGTYGFELRWSGGVAKTERVPVEIRASTEVVEVGREFLRNGDFEAGLEGWDTEGRVSAKALRGANGQGLTGISGDFAVSQTIAIPAGLRSGGYAISAHSRGYRRESVSLYGDRGYLSLQFLNENGISLGELRTLSVDQSSWQRLSARGPIPKGAHKAVVKLVGYQRLGQNNEVAFDDVSVKASPIAVGAARLSKWPVLMPGDKSDGMTMVFETDFSDESPVVIYEAGGETHRIDALETTTIDARHQVHRAVLSGLPAGATVTYQVMVGESVSPRWRFRTSDDSAPFRMGWISDNQHGWKTFRTLIPLLKAEKIETLMNAGDIVQRGYELREWQTEWFSPLAIDGFAQENPIRVARGNHDANGALAHAYVPLPGNGHWYAYSRGGVRFIVLDSEATSERVPEQTRWLEQELGSEDSKRADFRVVVFHRTPYTTRWDPPSAKYDGELWVRAHWVPIFSDHKVDLVITGHAHAYQRVDIEGVRYLVIGGAGGRLDRGRFGKWLMAVDYVGHHFGVMAVERGKLHWVAEDFDGKVIDEWRLERRGRKVASP